MIWGILPLLCDFDGFFRTNRIRFEIINGVQYFIVYANFQEGKPLVPPRLLVFNQKFAIIDQKIVWYGSINLFSFGAAEESMMRLVSTNIAYELLKTVEANG